MLSLLKIKAVVGERMFAFFAEYSLGLHKLFYVVESGTGVVLEPGDGQHN